MTRRLTIATPAVADLNDCDREPIHVPGHIQAHGVLIATYPNSDRISHVSANLETSTGLAVNAALNRTLADVLGPETFRTLEAGLISGRHGLSTVYRCMLTVPLKPERNLLVHRHLGRTFVEISSHVTEEHQSFDMGAAQQVMSILGRADTVADLCQMGAEQLRHLTGYDRVMVYRFDAEGHGTVTAEAKADGLEPFLNLRYPASDIPQQARRLYLLQRLRTIADVDYSPTLLIAAPGADGEVDMTYCALRGVSPIHREYMRNMGVGASMAISLILDSTLWGMIVCHHRTPLSPSPHVRGFCELAGQLLSLMLHKISAAEALAERLTRMGIIEKLRTAMEAANAVGPGLCREDEALLALMDARGAIITIGGQNLAIGRPPGPEAAATLIAALRTASGGEIVAMSDAGMPGAPASTLADVASGVLFMPILNNPDDGVIWFRPEEAQTIQWGGDPNKAVSQDDANGRISPRKSFAAWAEVMRGRSKPWRDIDIEIAHEMRRVVMGVLLRGAEARLAHLSAYDPLTGLANRRTLQEKIDDCVKARGHAQAAMLFFDLDRFKAINDSLGHSSGDHVLIEVAERLRGLTPAAATAGRLGGDEFVVFCPGAGRDEAEAIGAQLMKAMGAPIVVRGQALRVTASIGIACSRIEGVHRLMQEADEAMYAAKRQGGGAASTFAPDLHARTGDAMRFEQDMFHALENNEFQIHYQPIVTAPGRRLVQFEALARWPHPSGGWTPPADFIRIAEETGLILRLGAWVLTAAVRQIAIWRRRHPNVSMAVNVSARQLMDASLHDLLVNLLGVEGVPADAIVIEVTESVMLSERALAELYRLRELGVRIALDDFGTGYSSLAYLNDLPIDDLKIDRRFIEGLGSSDRADRLFKAIVGLARTLDLNTIAEGCETEKQMGVIADAGCAMVQGWLIARAMTPEAVDVFLARELADP